MAYDLALDAKTHDLVINAGNMLLIDNKERIAQQAKIRLWRWRGEWFLDKRDGIPYIEYILVKNPNMKHVRQLLYNELSTIEGVKRVDSLILDLDSQNRILTVTFSLNTDYGIIVKAEVLGYGKE